VLGTVPRLGRRLGLGEPSSGPPGLGTADRGDAVEERRLGQPTAVGAFLGPADRVLERGAPVGLDTDLPVDGGEDERSLPVVGGRPPPGLRLREDHVAVPRSGADVEVATELGVVDAAAVERLAGRVVVGHPLVAPPRGRGRPGGLAGVDVLVDPHVLGGVEPLDVADPEVRGPALEPRRAVLDAVGRGDDDERSLVGGAEGRGPGGPGERVQDVRPRLPQLGRRGHGERELLAVDRPGGRVDRAQEQQRLAGHALPVDRLVGPDRLPLTGARVGDAEAWRPSQRPLTGVDEQVPARLGPLATPRDALVHRPAVGQRRGVRRPRPLVPAGTALAEPLGVRDGRALGDLRGHRGDAAGDSEPGHDTDLARASGRQRRGEVDVEPVVWRRRVRPRRGRHRSHGVHLAPRPARRAGRGRRVESVGGGCSGGRVGSGVRPGSTRWCRGHGRRPGRQRRQRGDGTHDEEDYDENRGHGRGSETTGPMHLPGRSGGSDITPVWQNRTRRAVTGADATAGTSRRRAPNRFVPRSNTR